VGRLHFSANRLIYLLDITGVHCYGSPDLPLWEEAPWHSGLFWPSFSESSRGQRGARCPASPHRKQLSYALIFSVTATAASMDDSSDFNPRDAGRPPLVCHTPPHDNVVSCFSTFRDDNTLILALVASCER